MAWSMQLGERFRGNRVPVNCLAMRISSEPLPQRDQQGRAFPPAGSRVRLDAAIVQGDR
jgi:hypothetical protein